jgi:hypothetical protein
MIGCEFGGKLSVAAQAQGGQAAHFGPAIRVEQEAGQQAGEPVCRAKNRFMG